MDAWNELSNQETVPCKATVMPTKSEQLPQKTNKPFKFREERRCFDESLETIAYFDSYAEMMEYIKNLEIVRDYKNYYGKDINIQMKFYCFDTRHGWDDKTFIVLAYNGSELIGPLGFCNNIDVPLDEIARYRENNRNVTQ